MPHYCGTERTAHSEYGDAGGPLVPSRVWPLAHIGGSACSCIGYIDRLVWQPERCRVAPFAGERLCRALGARRLLFVGDSTMQQLAAVVTNHVQWAFWSDRADRSLACADRLAYAPSDTLIGESLGRLNRGDALRSLLRSHDPDVLVVSAGAHVHGADRYALMLRTVAEAVREAAARGRAPRVIWSTLLGAGCSVEPLADGSPESRQALWRDLEGRGVRTHNWPNFSAYDALARDFWPATLPKASCVLDLQPLALRTDARIESPRRDSYVDPGGPKREKRTGAGQWRASRRRDGYRDCLHFCSPGPLRLVPALLQQLLAGCAKEAGPGAGS